MGRTIITIALGLISLMNTSNAQQGLNCTLKNCALAEFGPSLAAIGQQFSNLQNITLDSIFSFVKGDFRTLLCRNISSFDTCLKESGLLSDDILFQQYIDYNAIVPTINDAFCNIGDSEFQEGIACARETLGSTALCGAVLAQNAQSLFNQPTPEILCPLMDAIFDCSLLQARQCSKTYAEGYVNLRNVMSSTCSRLANSNTLVTPLTSKSFQCSYTLVGSSFDVNTLLTSNASFDNIISTLTGNLQSIVKNSCNNIEQFSNCLAVEVPTPGDRLGIDVAVKAAVKLDPSDLSRTLGPLCTFVSDRFTDFLNLRSCKNLANLTSCFSYIEDYYSNFQALNQPSDETVRQILCTPLSQSVRCFSDQIRDCDADIAQLVQDTASGLLRSDCGGSSPSSAPVIAHVSTVTTMSFIAFLGLSM